MIVNRYATKPNLEPHINTMDSFLLWNFLQAVKPSLKQETCNKWEKWIQERYLFETINKDTNKWLKENYDCGRLPIFSSIEIETINRCNGECPFCPVNRNSDPRKTIRMKEELFRKIVDELRDMNYSGRLALHSNNEPFLDNRITEFARYARENVPNAFIYMYTNGTLLSLEIFQSIVPYLDRMVIDNYDDDLKLHKNVEEIHYLCKRNGTLDRKVEIHVRKIHEILNTRGGQSPNNSKRQTMPMSCILPYKQMIVRPDGKTSLCCNDPYGKYTLADLNKISLKDAWYSERYRKIRKVLRNGRTRIGLCKYCDTLPGPKGY